MQELFSCNSLLRTRVADTKRVLLQSWAVTNEQTLCSSFKKKTGKQAKGAYLYHPLAKGARIATNSLSSTFCSNACGML